MDDLHVFIIIVVMSLSFLFVGVVTGVQESNDRWQQLMIEKGYMQHHPVSGEVVWVDGGDE